MRLIFIATGDIALPSFRYLLEHGPRPLALVTQPDKPVGRHQTLTPPAIKTEAIAAGIPVLQPVKISDAIREMQVLDPEILAVMAYGQILKRDVLKLPSLAIINLHGSLLPKHRGASCIQSAIDSGDKESGIAAIHVVRELDAGDVIFDKSIPITDHETGGSLHDRLADLAAEVLAETLKRLENGTAERKPQDASLSNYAPKLERENGRIDWSLDAAAIERRIRAYEPWPGTFTEVLEDGKWKRLKIFPPTEVSEDRLESGAVLADRGWVIGCGKNSLRVTSVQLEGSKRMSAVDYLRGNKPEKVR